MPSVEEKYTFKLLYLDGGEKLPMPFYHKKHNAVMPFINILCE